MRVSRKVIVNERPYRTSYCAFNFCTIDCSFLRTPHGLERPQQRFSGLAEVATSVQNGAHRRPSDADMLGTTNIPRVLDPDKGLPSNHDSGLVDAAA